MYTDIGLTVPDSFKVNEGGGGRVIIVQGPTIRIAPPLGRSRTFSVRDAARIVRCPKGRSFENVLLDAQGKTLCRFVREEKNGEVFLQYLLNQGVPFLQPDGRLLGPVCSAGSAPGPRFTFQLQRTAPVLMWIGVGYGLAMVLFCVGVPIAVGLSGSHMERNLAIVIGMIFVSLISPWVCAVGKGQLFPPCLTVEGERAWVSYDLVCRELCLKDMDCCRFQRSDKCYILYDKLGRPVIKFSAGDDFAPYLLDFLSSHDIRPRPN